VSKRSEHLFQFVAADIADAAANEADYHEARLTHWEARKRVALAKVKDTIGAKVEEVSVTGGTDVRVVVDYGDPGAWDEFQLSRQKVNIHRTAAERFRTDERVYRTQLQRAYELDTDDVHHFRLGGQPRED
jgi:hypothetical protein